jgi:O-antigen/teichoic acid export membrane protein
MGDVIDRRVIIRNAAANLASGAGGAVLAVFLPPFLVRILDRDSYSVWALLLQIGAYTALLNFGLQTAVGRFVAQAEARNDSRHGDKVVSTALLMLSGSAAGAGVIIVGLAALLPHLFPDIPGPLADDARTALIWVGGSLAIGLPFAAISGVFTGIQRNEIPAAIIVASRLVTAAGLIVAAGSGRGIVTMAKVFAVINLLTYAAQWAALKRFVPHLKLSRRNVGRQTFRELIDYCASLTVWSFAMLLVSGLDLVLVARFDFAAVGAFAIATGLVNLLQGAQGVIMNAFLPVAAALDAEGNRTRLINLLLRTTRWNLLCLGAAITVYALAGRLVLIGYVGLEYVQDVAAILSLLLLAATIRLSMLPYNIVAMGTGDHRRIIVGPMAEGICNLLASAFLGWHFGAIGVAWGTVVGGVVGVAFHLWLNIPRSVRLGVGLPTFAAEAFIPAMIAIAPLIVVMVLQGSGLALSGGLASIVVPTAAIGFLLLAWHVTLRADERQSIVSRLKLR